MVAGSFRWDKGATGARGTYNSDEPGGGIENISGTIADDAIVTVTGGGFSIKTNPKPLLYWRADDGTAPSALGRTSTWDGFVDSSSTVQVLPNSTQSFRHDWGAGSSSALANMLGIASTGRYYIYRKIFDDWNFSTAKAFRIRLDNLVGTFIVGETVTGSTSGATGVIQKFTDEGGGDGTIFFEPTPTDFDALEPITAPSGATANILSGGLLKTMNYKSLRLRAEGGDNNIFHNMQGNDGPEWRITPEFTDDTFFPTNMDIDTVEAAWYDDEVFFQDSSLGVKNGVYNLKVNNFQGYPDTQRFITRDSSFPLPYTRIVQGQVSNGAQPNTFTYYDTVYVDDTWHSVFIAAESTFSAVTEKAVCIPSLWSDGSITCRLRQAGFASLSGKFMYVKAANSLVVNENGFLLP